MINAAHRGMAEVIFEYDTLVGGPDGSRWAARTVGRPWQGEMWEGWVEFVPVDGDRQPMRSPRETTQPFRDDLLYWASGLTPVFLRGALIRALQPPLERPEPRQVTPHFDEPAPSSVPAPSAPLFPHPILDPFDVYGQGEDILVRQLDALDTSHLRDIARAYELMNAEQAQSATRLDLASAIVNAARAHAARV
jgi:hypothetical protein